MNLSRSIEELEETTLGVPKYDSHLAFECHKLRTVPLIELSTENLRLLIGQKNRFNLYYSHCIIEA